MVTEDHIPRLVQVFSGGWAHEIIVAGYAESELVGRYMAAVGEFLRTNDRFRIDKDLEAKLLITVAPDGYLECVKDPPSNC